VRAVFGPLACALALSCGPARYSEPLHGPVELRSEAERLGAQRFFVFCHQCHPGAGGGLGPAINDKPLPSAMIRLQVRQGMGAMPSFSESEIPDPELDAIVLYLKALRDQDDRR
jgi:mono/diheme cytochrome c family protein